MTSWFHPIPLRAQLHEPSGDAGPDNNAPANCVPASLSSAFSWYTGLAYYGDELKDAVYGEGYTGATDPARFIAYAATLGVHMFVVACSGTAATDRLISEIKAGYVVTGAIPSDWNGQTAATVAAQNLSTHEVSWCGYDDVAQTLTAMNPEVGGQAAYQTMPVSWWAERIVYDRVLPMEGKAVGIVTPVWKPESKAGAGDQSLSYPAHDGLPAIVLVHAQADYAHAERSGVYPLHPEAANGAGDGIVLWNDGRQTRAEKAYGWAVVLEDGGPMLAQIYAAADQAAQLRAQLAAAQGKAADPQTAARAAAYLQIQAALAVK